MQNKVFLNGEIISESEASISPMDRGFLFGDGVYEVVPVYSGKVFCLTKHLDRLQNSCDGIRLQNPYSHKQWQSHIEELLKKNAVNGEDQSLYMQITRGAPNMRDHLFPDNINATTFMFSKPFPTPDQRLLKQGASLITADEIRWQNCHLKTTSLVANVLLKQMAHDENADEIILIRDGLAQECSASNFFIVKDKVVLTAPKTNYLLPGITRDFILQLMRNNEIACREENLTIADLKQADEIWVCSSTKELVPATLLDDSKVGTGKPGEYWQKVYQLFQQNKR